jgi:hypothetical protein
VGEDERGSYEGETEVSPVGFYADDDALLTGLRVHLRVAANRFLGVSLPEFR